NELHVIRIADGRDTVFIGRYSACRTPQWLPDSSGISFLAKRDPDKHQSLHVISLDGGEAQRKLAHETDINAYAWSPDGSRVAFIATDDEPKAQEKLKKKGFKAKVFEEDV